MTLLFSISWSLCWNFLPWGVVRGGQSAPSTRKFTRVSFLCCRAKSLQVCVILQNEPHLNPVNCKHPFSTYYFVDLFCFLPLLSLWGPYYLISALPPLVLQPSQEFRQISGVLGLFWGMQGVALAGQISLSQ